MERKGYGAVAGSKDRITGDYSRDGGSGDDAVSIYHHATTKDSELRTWVRSKGAYSFPLFNRYPPSPPKTWIKLVGITLGEIVGTYMLIAVGCSTGCVKGGSTTFNAWTFMLILPPLIWMFDSISGSKFNPVVSLVTFLDAIFSQSPEPTEHSTNSTSDYCDLMSVEYTAHWYKNVFGLFFLMISEMVGQLLGATLGSLTIRFLIPGSSEKCSYGSTTISDSISSARAVFIEGFMTATLVFWIFFSE
eukprot:TRINITY_DN25871_c0_g1_i1.p1 TRINITY_DN25871_c0_g1~~TRINITY_DN25871_c0_g1_i1.p1  ORF type:complete len:247 (-),score=37.07 TRINITY_DN25871_c0_g1_i1:236-976(-)